MDDARPYGSWPSPVTSELVVEGSVRLDQVWVDGTRLAWGELRPDEGGRVVVVRHTPGESQDDLLPEGHSARTRVHEYGGGAWWMHDEALYFTDWDDQRLYRFDPATDVSAHPLTPEPAMPGALRYADGRVLPDHGFVVCVRERHGDGPEPVNEIVAVPVDGGEPLVLVSGPDFVSYPRPSPDGTRLAWTQWNHPDMPWDATSLWVAPLHHDRERGALGLGEARCVAGADGGESVYQPAWSPDSTLHFVSDRTGWWNLYRVDDGGQVESVVEVDGEIGLPQWIFGESRYAFLTDGRVLFAYQRDGFDHLGVTRPEGGWQALETSYTAFSSLRSYGDGAALIAASPTAEAAVVVLDVTELGDAATGEVRFGVARPPRDLGLGPEWLATPEPVDFPTDGRTGHALLYRPTNPTATPPPETKPPLVVSIHGGPTSAARPVLDLRTQFWTSRGFAVVDVNYRGSTGYGREYRDALRSAWGIADVADCEAAARALAQRELVDADRLIIHGGSAGGFTTLAVLAASDRFAAGTTLYGVSDLEALARDTHKFESRYLDSLIGPYPDERERYVERSPIHRADRIDAGLLVLQGLEDEIVPPSQSELLVDALRRRGVPHAYLAFEGEQHGFRRAATIRAALEAELSFYCQVLGLPHPDGLPRITVEASGTT